MKRNTFKRAILQRNMSFIFHTYKEIFKWKFRFKWKAENLWSAIYK